MQSAQSTIKQAQGDISSRPVIAGTAAIGTAGSVTASGKTPEGSHARDRISAARCGDATASASQKLGIAGAEITLTIKSGETTYTDTALTATSTIQDVVDSINKSGVATASVGDDGKLTIKSTDLRQAAGRSRQRRHRCGGPDRRPDRHRQHQARPCRDGLHHW